MNLFDLHGKVVIITGGGRGIGAVYARTCAQAGMRVVLADIHTAEADAVAAEITGAGGSALAVTTDISSPDATAAMAQAALDAFGRIDGLVNNASTMSSLPRRSWMEIPVAEWDRVMAVDLRGLFNCCRAVHPTMAAQGSGRIVNISSSRALDGTPNRLHYTTAKAGVIGFTRALAREVGSQGIAVNTIIPGQTRSDTQVASSAAGYLGGDQDQLRAFARPQMPQDLCGALLFLLSDAASFITGQSLVVDGGKSMQ